MSSLIILFLAIIAVLGPLNTAKTASAQALDINKILELVQQQRGNVNSGASKQRRLQLRKDSSETSSDSDTGSDDVSESDDDVESDESNDTDNNRYGRSSNDKLLDLIDTLVNEKKYKLGSNDYSPYNNGKPKYSQNNYVNRNEMRVNKRDHTKIHIQHVLEKLFGNKLNLDNSKTKPTANYQRKKLKPNPLLPNFNQADFSYRTDDVNGLENYSKVYIVLNPKAVRQSRSKNALNDLISKVLSLSGSTSKRDRPVNSKPRRLRGLVVNDHVVRRSRQSSEIYAPRDNSNGGDYKPKKSRNGGNPLSGHTAIPYVRNRGDIYERNK